MYVQSHASHEACELKSEICNNMGFVCAGHASHEACELKYNNIHMLSNDPVTPRMRRVS